MNCRKIMYAFIHGNLAHSNDSKHLQLYKAIRVNPMYLMLENEFVRILAIILKDLLAIKNINEEVLRFIEEG